MLICNCFYVSVQSQVMFYSHTTSLDGSIGKRNLYLCQFELVSFSLSILINVEPYCIVHCKLVDSKIIEY